MCNVYLNQLDQPYGRFGTWWASFGLELRGNKTRVLGLNAIGLGIQ